jgi:multidrug efflux pump subunit AcrA (membrane-fusion protein)
VSESSTSSTNTPKPRRRSWIRIGLAGLVVIAALSAALVTLKPNGLPFLNGALAALRFTQPNGAPTAAAATDTWNYAEVVIADLRQEEEFNGKLESIKGTGTVIPPVQIDLGFSTPGTVVELPVQMGQVVQAGDVLARVDANTLVAQDAIAVAQAQINLDVAQQALDDLLNWEPDPDQIAQLEANLAAAQATYSAAQGQETAAGTVISVSEIGIAQAERQVAEAQAIYQNAWDPARDWELYAKGSTLQADRQAATAALQYAQENLRIARLNHDALLANDDSSGLVNAASQLLSAEQALATALAGPTEEQIAAAQTAVAQARLNLEQARLNQEIHLAGTTLIAPMAGTIMSVNGHLGAPSGAAPFVSLADLSQPTVEIYLDETNLDKMAVGSQVEVVFSALPAETFAGAIAQIDPQLVASGGLNLVRALVQLEDGDERTLPAGLTASVHVVGTSNRIVRLFLPLVDEGLLAVGEPVIVELPDFSQVPGTVVFVPQTPTASASGAASFQVLVDVDEPAAVAALADLPDETSVDVIYVSDSVEDVMAVPVTALVALLEGGYAVEVKTGLGQAQLVAVEVGFFGSNNMIAVTSDQLQAGDQVVVP